MKTGNYEVGYGRPPTASRWKKGQSGNITGKSRNPDGRASQLVREMWQRPVRISIGGRVKEVPWIEAVIRQRVAEARKGSLSAVAMLLKLRKHSADRGEARAVRILMPTKAEMRRYHESLESQKPGSQSQL